MYQHVLIPTDGSEGTQRAIKHAVALALELEATVHALSVVESTGATKRDQLRADPEAEARDALEPVTEAADGADLEVTSTIREGVPAEEILAYASENDVDMIVMATHGRTGLDHVLMGSVAEQVVRNSTVPVVTVRPTEEAT
ncbi:universal stress protein [Natronobeatus ordinarius]|uniref:universal stress protein n=1 Tax=Natronobeatus ordinarius TaxID=2963433 RepID=UPI0020CB9900|nr:universal stress protein [Natronobeatus ordinarius]